MKPGFEKMELQSLGNKLFWTAVIALIVAVKLTVTFFAPSLRAPAELPLAAFLLLVCAVQLFLLHGTVKRKAGRADEEKT